jgi:hypothetical protein
MSDSRSIDVLNRLMAIVNRSLPMYLADAVPWQRPGGDEKAAAALKHIIIDQQALVRRIGEVIIERGGRVDLGEFPMEYTDTHFLSLDFLLKELLVYQQRDVARIERLVDRASAADSAARELVLEALGTARAHLESLQDCTAQPAKS